LRYKSDDHFWFSFFHEAGHLLLHSKKETFVTGERDEDAAESEANSFAAGFLIPRQYESRLIDMTLADVPTFAEELGIAPGIVVGRLQKQGTIGWNQGNNLKRWFVLVEDDEESS
jgi:Zn-dependent peptidase ImmA (M78 family)